MNEEEIMLIQSFETDEDVKTVECVALKAEKSCDHVTDGASSLRVLFDGAGSSLIFRAGEAYKSGDWSHYGYLAFDIFNASRKKVKIEVSFHPIYKLSSKRAGPSEKPVYRFIFNIPIRTSQTLKVPFQHYTLMHALPPVDGKFHPTVVGWRTSYLNLACIQSFAITLLSPNEPVEIYLDNIRLLPGIPLVGIIDEFGQYTGAEWPGKVKRVEDLRKQAKAEEEALNSFKRNSDLDRYGGYIKGPKLKATGWFRTEKVDGKWWLVTPEGHIFWSIGANMVGGTQIVRPPAEVESEHKFGHPDEIGVYIESTIVEGREYMFRWLPDPDGPYGKFYSKLWGRLSFNFYALNLMRKYGGNYVERWMEVNKKRHHYWGLNTIGPWADRRLLEAGWAPFVTYIPAVDLKYVGMHRVLDPDFPEKIDRVIADATSYWRDSPWLIGYFVGYELPWGTTDTELSDSYMREGRNSPRKRALVNMLRERYGGDIEKLNEAWGTSFDSFDDLYSFRPEKASELSEAAAEDMREFLRRIAQRYFKCVAESLKRHDPNHLFLGCRFHSQRPLIVFKECAKYADVVTVNIWGRNVKDILDPSLTHLWEAIDKPVLILGFNIGALDRGMFHPGVGMMVNSQAERGKAYSHFIETAAKHPLFVGAHIYQYIDQPTTGRFDGENYNNGFVTITDTPHKDFIEKVRETNHKIYAIRLNS